MDGDDNVLCAEFSDDGKHIFFVSLGSSCCTIHVRDAATGQPARRPVRCDTDSDVCSAAFSSARDLIVVGLQDCTIQVWNTTAGQHIHTLRGHMARVLSVAFSPDSKQIVSGSSYKSVCGWDVQSEKFVHPPTVCIWDVQSEKLVHPPLQGHTAGVRSVAFSPDSNWVVSGSDDGMICLWDTTTGTLVHEPLRGRPYGISYTVQLWDPNSGQPIGSPLRGRTSSVTALAISPDGKFVVSGSLDGAVYLWDTKKQALCTTFHGHSDEVNSVAFSGDGQYIVSGSYDRTTIHIWDISTGERSQEPLEGHTDEVTSLAFSPDGKRIASGARDHTILLWDVETGQTVCAPLEGHTKPVYCVAFSPDGAYLVSSDRAGVIRIWDSATGQTICGPWRGDDDCVNSVVFSPNGRCVASGGEDGTVRVWDAVTGEAIREPFRDDCVVSTQPQSASFSPNKNHALANIQLIVPGAEQMSRFQIDDSFTLKDDGWLMGPDDRRLIWIPVQNRDIWRPQNRRTIIALGAVTTLDLSNFAHGEKWAECYEESSS
ncbi:WD40 repeat-like protein [Punctularia strigosozonata HHB-11173 SS5]|uniref:WD40 repeat-like protein n=1 Tax=Punctularia strigosozonata (strain HHB-11173) TaxID=741275 RepID=R7S0N5_PUNST|nr:WD40 repeat-like protein [Punctularia strigosozonata HHB-11173 SS5]EIN03362.1 WD40 repeat-like protein [Punctularia strigosozonata HHB-11173 SS5]